MRCSSCVGHACPVDAKNGAHNTFLPRALATGNADIVFDAEAIACSGRAGGASVDVMTDCSGEPVLRTVRADVVVVAAGAVESARLLLASGLGNDQLGAHLHDHRFVSLRCEVDEPLKNGLGPGHSIATLDHVHADSIPWGGGVLVDLMSVLPLTSAPNPTAGVARWGAAHKEWMRDGRPHAFGTSGWGRRSPAQTSAVTLAGVTDRWGRPGARLLKSVHPASLEVEAGMADARHPLAARPRAPAASTASARRHRLSRRGALVRHRTDERRPGHRRHRPSRTALGQQPRGGLRLLPAPHQRQREPDADDRRQRAPRRRAPGGYWPG